MEEEEKEEKEWRKKSRRKKSRRSKRRRKKRRRRRKRRRRKKRRKKKRKKGDIGRRETKLLDTLSLYKCEFLTQMKQGNKNADYFFSLCKNS